MDDLRTAVESVFRRESGRIIAGLIRVSGSFGLAEEAMQDAFTAALASWPLKGVPDNPAAWITNGAHRKLIDYTRRERTRRDKEEDLVREAAGPAGGNDSAEDAADLKFPDDRLHLIFTCCQPALNAEAQADARRPDDAGDLPVVLGAGASFGAKISQRQAQKSERENPPRCSSHAPAARAPGVRSGRNLPDLQ